MRVIRGLVAGFLAIATWGSPGHATVDAILDYSIVYREPQTDAICYRRLPMHAELGIPAASIMQAVFSPAYIVNQSGIPSPYLDINLVSTRSPMEPSWLSDGIDEAGTMSLGMKVDVTALAKANGSSVDGRQKTVRAAKLGLLSMARSMNELSRGKFKLSIQFVGLPSQAGLTGVRLPAVSRWPVTTSSPLLVTLERELIDVGGGCH